jgi:probable HAF family extracellular repeat protein
MSRVTTCFLTLLTALLLPLDLAAQGKGGKKPSPGPGVGYWFTWLGTLGGEESTASGVNNGGVVVGSADLPNGETHAFRVVPDVSQSGDLVYYRDSDGDGLNDLMQDVNDLGIWVDQTRQPISPCTALSAVDVNARGELVGTAEDADTGETRVFFFDPASGDLVLLPPPAGLEDSGADFVATAINDAGDVVGYAVFPDGSSTAVFYRWGPELVALDLGIPVATSFVIRWADLNNPGILGEVQIVTAAGYRLTLHADLIIEEQDLEFFNRLENFGINDQGAMCGRKVSNSGKGKSSDPGGAFRYAEQLLTLLQSDSFAIRGRSINSAGDVIVQPGWLYHDSLGLLGLQDLVVNPPLWGPGNERYNPVGMTDRDATGFPTICGRGVSNGYKAWVLTPVDLTP